MGRRPFSRDQFGQLAERLAKIEGRFLLSINDVPEIRRLFRGFAIEPIRTTYTLGGMQAGRTREARELLISGRPKRLR